MQTSLPNNNRFLGLLLVLFWLSSCQDPSTTAGEEISGPPPNIVLILSDDQAWTDYGFMGHDHLETPNLDRLSAEGITFVRSYVPTSLCAPSLASIITGTYPRRHQVLGNDRAAKVGVRSPNRQIRAERYRPIIDTFAQLNTLPKMLREKGYLSFQTGKWWLGNHRIGGFDLGMTHGDPARGGRHGDYGLKIGREGLDTLYNYIDYALEVEKPFFVWYAPYLPHRPHNPPDSLLQKYLPLTESEHIAKYWAMCEWFDQTCGALMDYIDDQGQTDNTLFVYVCDNGWEQKPDKSGYTKNSKRSPYDYGMRTPIIYKWSGKITPAFNPHSLGSSLDIVPTILDLVGIDRPIGLDGINILNEQELTGREAIFGEIYAHDFTTIDSSLYYRTAIADPYKLILPDPGNKPDEEIQLYDLQQDPYELTNLAESRPDIVMDLRKKIAASWK